MDDYEDSQYCLNELFNLSEINNPKANQKNKLKKEKTNDIINLKPILLKNFVGREQTIKELDEYFTLFNKARQVLMERNKNINLKTKEDDREQFPDFTPCISISGQTGAGKSSLITSYLHEHGYSFVHWQTLFPQDQKEMFLKRLAQTLSKPRNCILLDQCETISNSQLLPIVAFLRKCRKLMQSILNLNSKSKSIYIPTNYLEGMILASPVIFVCLDQEYLQARLQPLHSLCQHIFTPVLSTEEMFSSLVILKSNVSNCSNLNNCNIPLQKQDIKLLCERARGNWHKFWVSIQWCLSINKKEYLLDITKEQSIMARYDDVYSKDIILRRLFTDKIEYKTDSIIANANAMIVDMESEQDLDIVIWENQWKLIWDYSEYNNNKRDNKAIKPSVKFSKNSSPSDCPSSSSFIDKKHVNWSCQMAELDHWQYLSSLHNTEIDELLIMGNNNDVSGNNNNNNINTGGNNNVNNISNSITSSLQDIISTDEFIVPSLSSNSFTVQDHLERECISTWLYYMSKVKQLKSTENENKHILQPLNNNKNNSEELVLIKENKKTKRKYIRAIENHAKRGKMLCYVPSQWIDHHNKQQLVRDYILRMQEKFYCNQIQQGNLLNKKKDVIRFSQSPDSFRYAWIFLRNIIEKHYEYYCKEIKSKRNSAYRKKIVGFEELPLAIQTLAKQHGIEPNLGRIEGTYYFFFKFPGFFTLPEILTDISNKNQSHNDIGIFPLLPYSSSSSIQTINNKIENQKNFISNSKTDIHKEENNNKVNKFIPSLLKRKHNEQKEKMEEKEKFQLLIKNKDIVSPQIKEEVKNHFSSKKKIKIITSSSITSNSVPN